MKDLTEIPEKCNHPEEECFRSNADAMGMFIIHCKKCDTTFSRYDFNKIEDDRQINPNVRFG